LQRETVVDGKILSGRIPSRSFPEYAPREPVGWFLLAITPPAERHIELALKPQVTVNSRKFVQK